MQPLKNLYFRKQRLERLIDMFSKQNKLEVVAKLEYEKAKLQKLIDN